MKKLYKVLFRINLLALVLVPACYDGQVTTQTFAFTGAVQSFTVPPCVGTISITARGARGGTNVANTVLGGLGGTAFGILTVTGGDVLNFYVGGTNGYNGGGAGGVTSNCTTSGGGIGGGASDVRLNGVALSNRVIVAGGGGGAGGDRIPTCGRGAGGGGGSGYYGGGGGAGWSGSVSGGTVASGGSQTAGGTGGTSTYATVNNGFPGGLGFGGAGGGEVGSGQGTPQQSALTGGSGGGTSGNNGQATFAASWWVGQSGAGGSSYVSPAMSNTSTTAGTHTTNGQIVIAYTFNGAGVQLTSTSNSICAGTTVTLTASSVNSYTWAPGGSNLTTMTVAPTSNASYTVYGTNSFNCISNAVVNITVNAGLPTLTVANTASATSGICPTKTVALTASGAVSYTWTGGTPVTNGVAFAPTSTSGYTVTGANACGTSTASTSVSIHPAPTVGTVVSQPTVCSGVGVILTGTGASTYTWYPLSMNVTNGVSFTPMITQTYTVVGESALGCTNSAQGTVSVTTTPIQPPVLSTLSICNGNTATITATGATNYSWSTGATTSTLQVNPSSTTTYTITKWNANCFDTKVITLTVNPLPVVFALTNDDTVCASTQATLTTGGGISYTWVPGGTTPTQYTTVVSPSVATIYTVTAFDGFCKNTNTVEVATNPNPTLTVAASTSVICLGKTATINISGASTYSWVQPNLAGPSVTVSPTSATLYQVTGYNNYSCSAQASQIVLVNQLPVINSGMTRTLVCSGFPSTLTALGQHTVAWGHGPTGNTTVVNPVTTTIYTVTLTNTITTCSSTRTMQVGVFSPTFVTTKDTALCLGGSIILTASGATTYTWTGFPNNQPNIQITPSVVTVYTVNANSISPGNYVSCLSTKMVTVTIYPNPTITAVTQKTLICRNDQVNLIASGGATYVWANNVGNTQTVTVGPLVQTVYTVTGTDIFGCVSSGTVMVRVSSCPGFTEIGGDMAGLSVFPNPGNGHVNIVAESEADLELVNELGQVIRKFTLDASNNYRSELKIETTGIYFITGTTKDRQVYHKVIVTQ